MKFKAGDIVRFKESDGVAGRKPSFRIRRVDDVYIELEWVDNKEREEIKEAYSKDVSTMTESYPGYVDIYVKIPKVFSLILYDEDDIEMVENGRDSHDS